MGLGLFIWFLGGDDLRVPGVGGGRETSLHLSKSFTLMGAGGGPGLAVSATGGSL